MSIGRRPRLAQPTVGPVILARMRCWIAGGHEWGATWGGASPVLQGATLGWSGRVEPVFKIYQTCAECRATRWASGRLLPRLPSEDPWPRDADDWPLTENGERMEIYEP